MDGLTATHQSSGGGRAHTQFQPRVTEVGPAGSRRPPRSQQSGEDLGHGLSLSLCLAMFGLGVKTFS